MHSKFKWLLVLTLLITEHSVFAEEPKSTPVAGPGKSLFNHYMALGENDSGKFLYFTSPQSLFGETPFNGVYVDKANNFTDKVAYLGKYQGKSTHIFARSYVTFDPSGKYLFLVNAGRNFVSQFQRDSSGKKFIPNTSSSGFQLPCQDLAMPLDPFRSLQFFKNDDSTVRAIATCKQSKTNALYLTGLAFNTEKGILVNPSAPTAREISLQPIFKSPNNENFTTIGRRMAEIADPQAILIGPKGEHVYYIDNQHQLHQKDYDPRAYMFIPSETQPIRVGEQGSIHESMSFDSAGKHVYVVNYSKAKGSSIQKYTLDARGNILVPPAGESSNFAVPNPEKKTAHATYIQFAPSNNYAYVLDQENGLIYQYEVDSAGALKPLKKTSFDPGFSPYGLVFDSSNKFAYALKFNEEGPGVELPQFSIEKLAVGPKGELSLIK